MGYWLIAIFLSVMVLFRGLYSDDGTASQRDTIHTLTMQHAAMVIGYLNALNDYLHGNPLTSGVVPDTVLAYAPPPGSGIHNVVQDSRVMVYLPDTPGLATALLRLSRHSALLCRNDRGELIDLSGAATGISTPTAVADSDLVYLN
ncbi:type IV pilus biogenesis protein PilM [Citrobacter koseri]|uniref:type IV pilus biogenesis protein PilM n=1 Tax=Citrobacter koseri TaxID=545 RepID=UPI001F44E739|nr:type IV pilus biogenesis protein PilM [Citrobacter koseri]